MTATAVAAGGGLLQDFNHDALHVQLGLGDIVTLLPDSRNGLVAFSSVCDGVDGETVWIQLFTDKVTMPPNIADTRFRLVPKLHSQGVEEEIDIRRSQSSHSDTDEEGTAGPSYTMGVNETDVAEIRHVQGKKLRFGDILQIQHVVSGLYLSVLPKQALERGKKMVRLLKRSSSASLFIFEPAFKTYSTGDQVYSGDQVMFRTVCKLNHHHMFLSMSQKSSHAAAARQLQLAPWQLQDAHELNASAEMHTDSNGASIWRPIISSSWQDQVEQQSHVKCEDLVCLYHKEGEKYLTFDPARASDRPQLYPSRRVSEKGRKKSWWLWKIESVGINHCGDEIHCRSSTRYRIRHVLTERVLVLKGGTLKMSPGDYLTGVETGPLIGEQADGGGSCFTFKQFDKTFKHTGVEFGSLIYLREADSKMWVTENTWLSRWMKDTYTDRASFTTEEREYLQKQFISICKSAGRSAHNQFRWDVFLSYRVAADTHLVDLLYSKLTSTSVEIDGVSRPLRVFWDVKCLQAGEGWEEGFINAICSCHLVVPVLSRQTFAMPGKPFDISGLKADSCCDNVCLELELALLMKDRMGTSILPLLVGDLETQPSVGEMYTDFFEAQCKPVVPDVRVEEQHAKIRQILADRFGESEDEIALRSVREVFQDVLKEQGVKCKGVRLDAVEKSVSGIYECISRLTHSQAADGDLVSVSYRELPDVLAKFGFYIRMDHLTALLREFDNNSDGRLSLDEFEPMLIALKKHAMNARKSGREGVLELGGEDGRNLCSEIGMIHSSGRPTRDAFWVLPVSQEVQAVVHLRDKVKTLQHFKETLEAADRSRVVALFDERRHTLVAVVRSLLLELTEDGEMNVMSREGRPNKELQKRLREARAIDIAMGIISLPFEKGFTADMVAHEKSNMCIKDVICHLYRLMKQSIKGNKTNSLKLFRFLKTIQAHLGKGFSCMQVLQELFFEKLELIIKIERTHIARIVSLLNDAQDPRYLDYLQSLCTCRGKPVHKIQEYITQELLDTMMGSRSPQPPPQQEFTEFTVPVARPSELLVKVCKICDFQETSGFLDVSDPCVQVTLGGQSQRTTIKRNAGGSATFDEIFSFNKDGSTSLLKVVVYDSDSLTNDTVLGEVEVDLSEQYFSDTLENVASGTPFHVQSSEKNGQGTVFLAFALVLPEGVADTGLQALTSQHILPQIDVLSGKLRVFLAGLHDADPADIACGYTEKEPWLDIARFKQKVSSQHGKSRDLASAIMSKPFDSLKPDERKFRYFIRCLNLFAKLALGRNHPVLRILLTTRWLGLTYTSIKLVMTANSLPLIVRSSFTRLMQHLFVDRHPRIELPGIQYTRVWSKKLKGDEIAAAKEEHTPRLTRPESADVPNATSDDLAQLVKFLLSDLFNLGYTSGRNEKGESVITAADVTMGEIEYMISQVELSREMLRFSLLTKNRISVQADLSNAKRLFDAMFRMLDLSDRSTVTAKTPEGMLLMKLREDALKVVLALCDIRANFRVSLAVDTFESIFDLMAKEKTRVFSKPIYRSNSSSFQSQSLISLYSDPSNADKVNDIFDPYKDNIKKLLDKCFSTSIVSPDNIGADTVHCTLEDNKFINCLLGLCEYQDRSISEAALSLIFRTGSQTARFIQDLSSVSLLASEEGLSVFNETKEAIRRLSSIQRRLNKDEKGSYIEAVAIISGLEPFLVVSDSRTADNVKNNQKLMFDLGLDQSLITILHLHLQRKPVSSNQAAESPATGIDKERGSEQDESVEEFEPDIAPNTPRRDLFQKVFDLLALLAAKYSRGQCQLEGVIPLILGHVGIQDLNAVSVVRAILEGNFRLCHHVSEDLISLLISANLKYGRRARWLDALEVFLECNGKVDGLENNQDLILRLLLEDKQVLLDFTCDYTDSSANVRIPQALRSNDSRRGLDRIGLMLEHDHLKQFRSLLKFHVTSLRLLAMCTAGKNQGTKDTCAHIPEIHLEQCIDNYLDVDLRSDGVREARLDLDVIFYVQTPYVQLINNVYLTSAQASAARLVQENYRWWPIDIAAEILRIRCPPSAVTPRLATVMGEFLRCLVILERRLAATEEVPNTLDGWTDAFGSNLAVHVGLGCVILQTLASFFQDRGLFSKDAYAVYDDLIESLTITMLELSQQFCRHRLTDGIKKLVRLQTVLRQLGFWNIELMHEQAAADKPSSTSEEEEFLDNWTNFTARLALDLDVDLNPVMRMVRFAKYLAPVFKSERWLALVSLTSCMDVEPDLLLTGVRVMTAFLYLQPDNVALRHEWRDLQWQRFCDQQEPLLSSNTSYGHPTSSFSALQDQFARGGVVETVISCICNENPDIAAAGLRLGVVLLHHGCSQRSMQLEFRSVLKSPGHQLFFKRLSSILQKSKIALREGGNPGVSKPSIEIEMMFLIFKMMKRLFIGQQRELQDMFRVQKLNRESVNLLHECIQPLGELLPFCNNVHIAGGVTDGFEMLAESMSGGNFVNQHDLAAGGVLNLADHIFSTLELKTEDKERWTSKGLSHIQSLRKSGFSQLVGSASGNRVVPLERQVEEDTYLTLEQQNVSRSRLKQAASRCVAMFLEGMHYQEDQGVVNQILMTLQVPAVLRQLTSAHKQIVSGVESTIPTSVVTQEGLSYYMMLKSLEMFDRDGEYVAPALSHNDCRHAVRFFEQRVGCVEVMHGARLERVLFPLPASCLPGRPLTDQSHWEPLLHTKEWTNRDEKDLAFVRHLLQLVRKDQLLKALADLHLEFTINLWPHIQAASTLSAFVLHIVIVLGGYTEYWMQERMDSEGLKQEDFLLAGTDMRPVTTRTVKYLLYLHSILIALRFSSFALGTCPLIVADRDKPQRKQADAQHTLEVTDDKTRSQGVVGTGKKETAPDLAMLMGLVKAKIDASDDSSQTKEEADDRSGRVQARRLFSVVKACQAVPERVRGLMWLGMHVRFWYESALVVGVVFALAYQSPIATFVSLMDMLLWQSNATFVHALRNSALQIAGMVAISLMIVYVHLIIAMWTLPQEIKLASCSSMYTCVMFVFHEAFSGGNVYDIFADKYAAASNVGIDWGDSSFWRFFYEFSYMILFGQVMMAVIVAVLIDSMQELRFSREAALQDLKMRCFVCDLSAVRLEQEAGLDFATHTQEIHNPQLYLYFLIHLKSLQHSGVDVTHMTAVERYVLEKVWGKSKAGSNVNTEWLPSTTWMPLLPQDTDRELNVQDMRQQSMEAQMKEVLEHVKALSAHHSTASVVH